MSSKISSLLATGLRRAWWLLDASRRALLNLLFLALLVAALAWVVMRSAPAPALKAKTALVLDIGGRLAEQQTSTGRAGLLRRIDGDGDETRLRDVLDVLEAATKDEQITHALLMLDDLSAAGLPTLREVATAIDRFKAAGKTVIAWGSAYDQRQYFLAAHASEVWMHPLGDALPEGYGSYRSYYKDLFDRIGVSANVIRAGKFKNAGETYAANAPSPETVESDAALYGSLWASYTGAVEAARKLPAGSIAAAIASLPASLQASGGDGARWALERKWVDALKTRDEMREAMIARGERDEDIKSFRQISAAAYLDRIKPRSDGEAIGVLVAQGPISDGRAPSGRIGGLSTAELIRKAREDDKIKALVLRVDSPGGSVLGSELVRRELELTRKAGKPVVVSMGDVAASGGYWISMAADEVIADEATITGSIGVVAMMPSGAGAMDKLGVHVAGAGTTWLVGAHDVRRGIDPRFAQLVQSSVDYNYRGFVTLVADARKSTPEKINAVAQGRVWSGKDALAHGLVDRLGSREDAFKAAAQRAKLGDGWRVQYIEAAPSRLDRWLRRLGISVDLGASFNATWQQALLAAGLGAPLGAELAAEMAADLAWLGEQAQGRRPYAVTVHCLCEAP